MTGCFNVLEIVSFLTADSMWNIAISFEKSVVEKDGQVDRQKRVRVKIRIFL